MAQRKFDNREKVLQTINSHYIQLSPEKVAKNRIILEHVLNIFKTKMRLQDPLFNAIFYDVFYGGSFYDGLKVGKPDEFDLDFLMDITKVAEVGLELSNIPGFMHLKLLKMKDRNLEIMRQVVKFCDSNYFITDNILRWMQSIVQRVFSNFSELSDGDKIVKTPEGSYRIWFSRSGPAITLHLFTLNGEDYYKDDDDGYYFDRPKVMSIDLVPCFTFKGWPPFGFISNPYSHFTNDKFLSRFFIVPKEPKHSSFNYLTRYWRLSFQAQERKLIENKNRLKPTIRLLKKLRDRYHDDKIASYYIKTVLFHIILERNESFWDLPLYEVFMTVLKEYVLYLRIQTIPFYWYPRYNLISRINSVTLQDIANRLSYMIRDIEINSHIPEIVAGYLLSEETFEKFMEVGPLPNNEGYSSSIIIKIIIIIVMIMIIYSYVTPQHNV